MATLTHRIAELDLAANIKCDIIARVVELSGKSISLLEMMEDDDMLREVLMRLTSSKTSSFSGESKFSDLVLPVLADKLKKYVGVTTGMKVQECVTVISPWFLATHAHGDHMKLKVGDSLTCKLGSEIFRSVVKAVDTRKDFVLLLSSKELEAPKIDCAKAGSRYMLIGNSGAGLWSSESVSDGMFVSDWWDNEGHYRGTMSSCDGDSGGGVFAIPGGELVSIDVGNDMCDLVGFGAGMDFLKQRKQARSHSVPVLPLLYLCQDMMPQGPELKKNSALVRKLSELPTQLKQLFKKSPPKKYRGCLQSLYCCSDSQGWCTLWPAFDPKILVKTPLSTPKLSCFRRKCRVVHTS